MTMIELKTSELIGAALNFAVARVVDYKPALIQDPCGPDEWIIMGRDDMYLTRDPEEFHVWSPSTEWSQCGPLLRKFSVDIEHLGDGRVIGRIVEDGAAELGPDELIAACRAIVAARLGDTVSVPAELVEK